MLTGRVSQRGDNLLVGTELLDVTAGSQLWGERFQRKISDLFALEEEIALKISGSLEHESPASRRRLRPSGSLRTPRRISCI